MAKPKVLTPQEIYKQRRERDEKERTAYLPPGLINHGNTCFMNSVLQGLIATRLLDDLVHFTPIPPEIQQTVATPIVSRRSPQLTNGHNLAGPYEQAWVNTMPIGDMFLNVVYKAWDSQALRRRDVLSPKSILATLGQKYDQYLDFAQQDAHEFLRILLDAMRMEEQDIIKKRQPLPPNHKKRRRTTITPSNSQHNPASGSSSSSRSPVPVPSSSSSSNEGPSHSNPNPNGDETPAPINPDEESLLSFVDMLFGGQLTSILVCQKCKNVSQTYEDFNDISLSIKAEDYLPHNRKRDRFKKIVGRLTAFPGTSSSHGHHASSTKDSRNSKSSSSNNNDNKKDGLRPPVQPSHIVEMQRSSSVPPSPRIERSDHILGPGEDEVTRRRSLDVPTVRKPVESGSGSESPSPDLAAQSSTPVVVVEGSEGGHVPADIGQGLIGPESGLSEHKHVEFLEPKPDRTEKQEGEQNEEKQASKEKSSGKQKESHNGKEKEKSSKQDDSWAKIGRRISLSVGLGRKGGDKEKEKDKEKDKEKEKDKKERERKGRSVDRSGGGLSNQLKEIKEVAMEAADLGMKKLSALESLAKPSGESNQDKKRIPSDGHPPISTSSSSSNTIASSSSPELHGQKTKPLPTPPITTPPLPSVPPGSSKHDLLSPQPASASSHHAQPSNPAPLAFPNVQRSKSPKPPKPSNAEAEYLRRILADVSASPSSNSPFSIFKPPLLHSHSSHHSSRPAFSSSSTPTMSHPTVNSSGGTGQGQGQEKSAATWLGMGIRNLSGLEECLRLFTAVEVLDGDNMVGCRRCWKIQNGVYHAKEKQEDSDLEEEEEEEDRTPSSEGDANGNGIKDPNGSSPHKSPHPITIPTATVAVPVQLPTSISTPSVWVYSQDERSDTRSVSSLPTSPVSASQVSLDNSTESGGSSAATSEAPPPSNKTDGQGGSDGLLLQQRAGPGGLPIPVISTTSPPETPTTWSSSMEDYSSSSQEPSSDRRETNREASYARLTGQGVIANGGSNASAPAPAPHPRLTQALYGYNPSTSTGSRDSLVIPQIRSRATKYQKRKSYSDSTTTDNDSSGDESDTSIGTSVSAESNRSSPGPDALAAQGQSKPSQGQTTTTVPAKKKVPKPPKPVVMRPAYKRYLIATPPPVLVIHLKRFQQTTKTPLVSFSHGFKKLEDYVSFPEYLDLLPFLAPRKEDYGLGRRHGKGGTVKAKAKAREERCMYRLYAVVVHIGNMLGGHYFAYTALPQSDYSSRSNATAPSAPSVAPSDSTGTKESFKTESASSQSARPSVSEERQWAYISDTTVRLTTLEEVLHAKAYICMYERC